MNFQMKQISSLIKVRSAEDLNCDEIQRRTVLAGERFCYQISMVSDTYLDLEISAESELTDFIRLYQVNDVFMDMPVTAEDLDREAEDYLSYDAGMMPDILLPLEQQRCRTSVFANGKPTTLWIRIDIPKDAKAGVYPVRIVCAAPETPSASSESSSLKGHMTA